MDTSETEIQICANIRRSCKELSQSVLFSMDTETLKLVMRANGRRSCRTRTFSLTRESMLTNSGTGMVPLLLKDFFHWER
eukprot:1142372-Pelagomonas_calceolata.AAC.1